MSAEPEAAPEFEPSAINITNFASERIHAWTGVNEARTKLGLTGKGIRVAVIDSGVDYMNPALGGGFGPGFKVAYGYDLVGDAYSFTNPVIKPDNDPMDNCSSGSHGTHVAGIVGAFAYGLTGINNPTAGPFSGAAPEATIGAYRVFGCAADFTSEDFVAQAIFLAAKDNSHIINLSLGGGPVFADGADSYAAEVVGKAGHYVVASNGNSQSAGLMTNGSPAISRGGLGIASFDNTASPQAFMSIEGRRFPSTFGTANSAFKLNEPLEVVAFNVDADDLNILNDGLVLPATGTLNVAGKAIMFRGGNGTVAQRCTNAVTMGAAACIVYSNTIVTSTNPGVAAIPSLTTSNAAGRLILDVIKAGRPAFVRMSLLSSVSSFSSPGLDPELYIKPDVGGMGGSIYSTLSRFAAGAGRSPYGTKSGTSMSSPYTAGALALLLEAKGAANLNFETVRTLIMNTATPANIIRSPLVDSVTRQGAGLINIYNAITTKTIVSPPALSTL
ncbi:peptidase S8/S53 domain-containing protein [Chytridium lagenaria]|nr:peptidase S8/S53 domain-containing protein [Chytridium lagenaria]